MKKFTSLIFVLFMAIVVNAQTTETYDFYSFATGDGYMTTVGDPIAIDVDGTATASYFTEVYKVNNLTIGSTTMNFNERFAFNPVAKSGYYQYWRFRNTGTNYQKGLVAQWNGKGTNNTTFNMSILGLYNGDKVTITYAIRSGKSAELHFIKSGIATLDGIAVSSGDVMKSGKTYTIVAKDNNTTVNLDLYDTDNNIGIHTVTIVSDRVAETVEAPNFAVTGVYNGNRTITITPATEGTAGTAIKGTYYTTDGSEPSDANGEVYNTPFVISESSTIKAITYLENGIASDVATFEVEAGTPISLNNNIVDVTDLTGEGEFLNPVVTNVYTSAGLIGTPTATFTYTFNGETIELPYTVTENGTLVATATADGYASATETLEIKASYIAVKSADFTTITEDNLVEVLGDTWSITTTNTRWSGWDKSQGDIYTIATCSNPANLTEFIGSTCGTMIVGYGLARNHTSATEYWIANPEEGQIAVYEVNEAKKATTDFVKYTVAYADNTKMSHSVNDVKAIAKVTLYSPARELVVTDLEDLTATGTYTSASYVRLFNTEYTYGTICLPFAPDAATCANYTFYKLAEANAETLVFEEEAEPKANVAYLYKLNDGVDAESAKTFTGGMTTISDVEVEGVGGWQFVGSFVKTKYEDLSDGLYYAYTPTAEKNILTKATNSLTVHPYRAFFKFVETEELNFTPAAATMRMIIGGKGDGAMEIQEVIAPEQIEGEVFDLEGRPVEQMQKGQIYIVGGKKVMK